MIAASSTSSGLPVWGGLLIAFAVLAAYLVPSIVGYVRHVRDFGSVVVINVLLGWSVIGWIVALAMALRTARTPRWAAGQAGDDSTVTPIRGSDADSA